MRSTGLWVGAAAALLASALAFASDAAVGPSNLRITIAVSSRDGEGKPSTKTYELITSANGNASMLIGSRVPIATRSNGCEEDGQSEPRSATEYSYHDVGFHATVESRVEEGTRIHLSGVVEISSIRGGGDYSAVPEPPVLDTMVRRFDVLAEDGKPIQLLGIDEAAPDRVSITMAVEYLE